MIGYSEMKVFSPHERYLWDRATRLVGLVDHADFPDLRCHELARAVGRVLELPVQDGYYGFVDHSWLWTRHLERKIGSFGFPHVFPHVLDVYSVGSLPMVRLVDGEHTSLPHVGWAYRPGDPRSDVDERTVDALVRIFEAAARWPK